jgi:hypothetical protein
MDQNKGIDGLRAAWARLNNLEGLPFDGIAFDLFTIMNTDDEEAIIDLDKILVHQNLVPKLKDLQEQIGSTKLELVHSLGTAWAISYFLSWRSWKVQFGPWSPLPYQMPSRALCCSCGHP